MASIARHDRVVLFPRAVGLSLVYAAPYFLPLLTATQAYFLMSMDILRLIVWPSVFTVLLYSSILWLLSSAAQRWLAPRFAAGFFVVLLSFLTVVAFKGVAEAAGYHWQDTIPRGSDLHATQQYFRLGFSLLVFVVVWSRRKALPQLCRLLSSLGFALGALAVLRLSIAWFDHSTIHLVDSSMASPLAAAQKQAMDPEPVTGRSRRVVWIIFDETDFKQVYERKPGTELNLANFNALRAASVFATNANSPASATLYSIPALLAAVPIQGAGVKIDRSGSLSLDSVAGKLIPFAEPNSVFGVLRSRGQTASVLGFLHPYCKLFVLERCDSFVWPETGNLSTAVLANVPDTVADWLRHTDYWASITQNSLGLLPEYLARDDALTFVHLNVPHLPALYADANLHLPQSPNPLTEYGRNLVLTDRILGQVIRQLRTESRRHEILLIVSTDHWLRNRWYRANETESVRPVPLLMWKVGTTEGIRLTEPVSTVHTAEMLLDFLHGSITSQADIAAWWQHQPIYPSFIAPST